MRSRRSCSSLAKFDNLDSSSVAYCLFLFLQVLADGSYLDPFVIFPYLRLPDNIKNVITELPNIDFNYNSSGWMTEQNFLYYIEFVFVKAMKQRNVEFPVLLFLDNHSSHISLNVSQLCDKLGVILITLYPNSTYVLQPLDCAVFRGLKANWTNLLIKKRGTNGNFKVTMLNFPQLLLELLNTYHNADAVRNGFKVCGIYEWNSNNIDFTKLLSSKTRKKNVNRSDIVVMSGSEPMANCITESSACSPITNNESSSEEVIAILEVQNDVNEISQEEIIKIIPVTESTFTDFDNILDPIRVDDYSNDLMQYGANSEFLDHNSCSINDSFYIERNERMTEDLTKNRESVEMNYETVPQCSVSDNFLDIVATKNNQINNQTVHRSTFQSILNHNQPLQIELDTPVHLHPLDLSMQKSLVINTSSDIQPISLQSPQLIQKKETINRDAVFAELKEIYGETKFKQLNNNENEPKDINEDILMRVLQRYRPVTEPKDLLLLPPTNKRLGVKNSRRQPYVVSSPGFRQFRSKLEKEKYDKKMKENQDKENKQNERNQKIELKTMADLEKTKQSALARAEKQIANAKRKADEKLIKLNKKIKKEM